MNGIGQCIRMHNVSSLLLSLAWRGRGGGGGGGHGVAPRPAAQWPANPGARGIIVAPEFLIPLAVAMHIWDMQLGNKRPRTIAIFSKYSAVNAWYAFLLCMKMHEMGCGCTHIATVCAAPKDMYMCPKDSILQLACRNEQHQPKPGKKKSGVQ